MPAWVQACCSTPTIPVGPLYSTGSTCRSAASSGSEAAAATGTGRVCGESASSAPSSTTVCTPRSVKDCTSSAAKPRQRMLGSMPCTRTTSRPMSSGVATDSRVVGQTSRSVRPSDTSITGRVTWKS